MADVDLSIFAPFLRAPRSATDYAGDYRRGQLEQLQLGEMRDKRAQMQAERQRGDQLRALMQGMPGASDEQRIGALRGGAFFDQADALEKSIGERAKTAAGVAETKSKTATADYDLQRKKLEHVVGGLRQFTQPEDARQWLADSVTNGAMSMPEAQKMMSRVPRDPMDFGKWRDDTLMSTLDAAKQAGFIMPDANAKLSATTQRANNADNNARMAAEGAANRSVQMRGQNMTDARTREGNAATLSKPFEVTGPDGTPMLVQQSKKGSGIVDLNGNPVTDLKPKGMGSTKLTEDQGKATGWLTQATNAFSNMNSVMAANPKAAKPNIGDVVAAIPSFGIGEAVGNKMRGKDRQKFVQGASSLSEALLRAATGAGVNKDEALQKVRELTPQWGEDDETTQQKMDAIPLYIESLKVRAGPGAAQVPGIFNRVKGTPAAAPAAPSGWRVLGVEGQ